MSYYQASGLYTTVHQRALLSSAYQDPQDDSNDGSLREPFLNYLFSQQVFVRPRIDLFTKTKFMETKQRRINRR